MTNRNDGGAAFPHRWEEAYQVGGQVKNSGMTLRDYFAAHADVPWNAALETLALKGVSQPTVGQAAEYRATLKYVEADAMLAARYAA